MIIDWKKQFNINSISNEKILGVLSLNEFKKLTPHFRNNKEYLDISIISILPFSMDSLDLDFFYHFKEFKCTKFNDIEESDASFTKQEPISDTIAFDLKRFIMRNINSQFLIHCVAGQSRSAGVARAIECLSLYSGDLDRYLKDHDSDIAKNPRYETNFTVMKKIVNA